MPDHTDDDLRHFAIDGPPALPQGYEGRIDRSGGSIWFKDMGEGRPVLLLHGGMGNANQWGYQVPALIEAGCRVIAVDSRGHGRSTRDDAPMAYDEMARDVIGILDRLGIAAAAAVGWSDGAVTGLAMARMAPERVRGVFYFACNVDASGALPFAMTPTIERCLERHRKDHAALSAAPDGFDRLFAAVGAMQQSQPDYSAADLAAIGIPVTVAQAEHDEFIRSEHADYIAASIPGAQLVRLAGVSHFAPVQRPALFNAAVLAFLERLEAER